MSPDQGPLISGYLAILEQNNTSRLNVGVRGLPFLAGLKCREELLPPAVPEGVGQMLDLSPLGLVEVRSSKLTSGSRNDA